MPSSAVEADVCNRAIRPSNPNKTGVRPRFKDNLPDGGVLLDYAVRKPMQDADVDADGRVYQTDYEQRWQGAAE